MNGNISADPLFADPVNANYHLQLGSPAIDAGDNTAPELPAKDIDGDPRILDGDGDGVAVVDMGVDEFTTCGNSVVDAGEQCDLGVKNGQPGFCCSATCQLKPADTVCRAATGACDAAETCTGTSPVCPDNGLK
ncbi:MAG: hypothetical protein E6J80_00105, partial [Deltaproteobacteria bacterium]